MSELKVPVEIAVLKEFESTKDLDCIFGSFTGPNDIIVCFMTQQSQGFVTESLTHYENLISQRALTVITAILGKHVEKFNFFSYMPGIESEEGLKHLSRKVS